MVRRALTRSHSSRTEFRLRACYNQHLIAAPNQASSALNLQLISSQLHTFFPQRALLVLWLRLSAASPAATRSKAEEVPPRLIGRNLPPMFAIAETDSPKSNASIFDASNDARSPLILVEPLGVADGFSDSNIFWLTGWTGFLVTVIRYRSSRILSDQISSVFITGSGTFLSWPMLV